MYVVYVYMCVCACAICTSSTTVNDGIFKIIREDYRVRFFSVKPATTRMTTTAGFCRGGAGFCRRGEVVRNFHKPGSRQLVFCTCHMGLGFDTDACCLKAPIYYQSDTVVRQTDFDVIVRQSVVSDRNPAHTVRQ